MATAERLETAKTGLASRLAWRPPLLYIELNGVKDPVAQLDRASDS
jgi:hypothetical protein